MRGPRAFGLQRARQCALGRQRFSRLFPPQTSAPRLVPPAAPQLERRVVDPRGRGLLLGQQQRQDFAGAPGDGGERGRPAGGRLLAAGRPRSGLVEPLPAAPRQDRRRLRQARLFRPAAGQAAFARRQGHDLGAGEGAEGPRLVRAALRPGVGAGAVAEGEVEDRPAAGAERLDLIDDGRAGTCRARRRRPVREADHFLIFFIAADGRRMARHAAAEVGRRRLVDGRLRPLRAGGRHGECSAGEVERQADGRRPSRD